MRKIESEMHNNTEREEQSELPRLFQLSSVESDHDCTLRIYFDNAGANGTLTLYNVTLTAQKTC